MTAESVPADPSHRQREELFRLIVESAQDYAIFTTDLERRVTSWNVGAQRLMGWSEDEFVGRSADDIFVPEDREDGQPEREAGKALAEGRSEDKRWHLRKDGSRFWGDGIMCPLRDDAGDTKGFIKILRDRTPEVRAEEARREADRRKDEFLAMLAHELRNPLAASANASELSLRPEAGEEAVAWAQEVIARQVKSLSHMVNDLLDISRINRGKVRLRKEPLHVGPVITRAVEAVSHLFEERSHELNVSVATGPMRVNADPTRLEQVITNLLVNAAKYTDPGGSISVAAHPENDTVVIEVKDNGIGLPPEMLAEVFELFSQVDRSLERTRGGLGIGLSVVKRLVDMHGGSVRAWSEGPGKGSAFEVRLPALRAEGARGRRRPRRSAGKDVRARRILVVDDNVDSALGLARLLRLSGHEVESVHDGEAAIEAAEAFRPDVFLLDLGLPGLSGYEIASRLRSRGGFAGAVFIAISGYGLEHDRERSRAAGFHHHLAKPIDAGLLAELIASPQP